MNKFETFFLRVSLQDKVLFAKHLAISIKSGMTLLGGLELISDQTKSVALKRIIVGVIAEINAGVFLSKALEKYESVFGPLFINIIRIGESSGTLYQNLEYLTSELTKKNALKSKIRGALIYPAVILVATLGIAAALVLIIFPKIIPVFQSVKVTLPVTTRALIAISKAMSNHGVLIAVALIVFIILIAALLKIRFVRHAVQHIMLGTPFVKQIVVKFNVANAARTLGLLLNSGVNIIEAMNITADTTSNLVYQHELRASGKVLQKGEFLSSYLKLSPRLFPVIMTNMIRVGEETGNLTDNLKYLSEYYEEQVDDFVKNLSSVIEPALMIVMGVIVGFIALSIITPIYSLTQGLQQ